MIYGALVFGPSDLHGYNHECLLQARTVPTPSHSILTPVPKGEITALCYREEERQ